MDKFFRIEGNLVYNLKYDGRRLGKAVYVNDIAIRITASNPDVVKEVAGIIARTLNTEYIKDE